MIFLFIVGNLVTVTTLRFRYNFFFLSGFSFIKIHDSQDSRERFTAGKDLLQLLQIAHLCT